MPSNGWYEAVCYVYDFRNIYIETLILLLYLLFGIYGGLWPIEESSNIYVHNSNKNNTEQSSFQDLMNFLIFKLNFHFFQVFLLTFFAQM